MVVIAGVKSLSVMAKGLKAISAGKWSKMGLMFSKTTKLANQSYQFGKLGDAMKSMVEAANPLTLIMNTLGNIFSVFGAIMSAHLMPTIEKLYEVMFSPTVLSAVDSLGKLFAALMVSIMPIIVIIIVLAALFVELIVAALMPTVKVIGILLESFMPLIMMLLMVVVSIVTIIVSLMEMDGVMMLIASVVGILVKILTIFAIPAFIFLMAVINAMGIAVQAVASTINQFVQGLVSKVTEGSEYISGAFMAMIGGVVGFINDVITSINNLLGTSVATLAVPHLATGGIVTSPTLALIGEAGAEAVVPLDRMGDFGGGGGSTYTTEINIGGVLDDRLMNELSTRMYLSERKARLFGGA